MGKQYNQLSLAERIEIYRLHANGISVRQIASFLGRSPSTLSRELRRNSKNTKVWFDGYKADRAQALALRRRRWDCRFKMARQPVIRAHVLNRLAMGWSPEQVSGRLAQQDSPMRISHESIYRYIYHRVAQAEYLNRLLPRKKSRRGKYLMRGGVPPYLHIKRRKSIHDRPLDINKRAHVGHWEADLMLFSKYGQAILVTHERKTRILMAVKLPSKKADTVSKNIQAMLKNLPQKMRQSMTFDNGTEFAFHHQLIDKLDMATWFCDVRAPWQKGGVENGILRLRRQLPRKTDLETITQKDLDNMIKRYNNTPRKCLGYQTPAETFSKEINLLHFKRESISPHARG
jgi:IS30 family transposase